MQPLGAKSPGPLPGQSPLLGPCCDESRGEPRPADLVEGRWRHTGGKGEGNGKSKGLEEGWEAQEGGEECGSLHRWSQGTEQGRGLITWVGADPGQWGFRALLGRCWELRRDKGGSS